MAGHAIFEQYEALNAHYPGRRPTLGADVKYVQCDGCDRIITFAVFHSEFDGGVDVCNICRLAAARSAAGAVVCADRRRRLNFARHPLCFVGPAPLPPRHEVDVDEVEAERRPEVLARRFAKSVDVVAPPAGSGGRAGKRRAPRGRPPKVGRRRNTCSRSNSTKQEEDENEEEKKQEEEGHIVTTTTTTTTTRRRGVVEVGAETEEDEEMRVLGIKRPRLDDSAAVDNGSNAVTPPGATPATSAAPAAVMVSETIEKVLEVPVLTTTTTTTTTTTPVTSLSRTPVTASPVPQDPSLVAAALESRKKGNDVKNEGIPGNCVTVEEIQAQQLKWERMASGAVARFFHHIQPGTKCIAERPSSIIREPLCVFDPNDIKEFTLSPNTCRQMARGFVGLTSCSSVICVRIIPTMPEIGLWFSVLCEEDYFTRLDIWYLPLSSESKEVITTSSSSSSKDPFVSRNSLYKGDVLPKRMYSVHVGKHTVVSMDWLPIPLHRTENNTLGFCTFIRGRYLVSSVLPRTVTAAAATADVANTDWSGTPTVAAEVCGATLLKRELEFVEVRWSSNGNSVAETFLFAVGRCTSVVVLQPTGDTRSGRVTMQVVHYIEARGVAPFPSFLKAPPIAISSTRSSRTILVVAHGASVACYQGPEFSTKLLVTLDDVVCSLQLHHRIVTAGLANGTLVGINDREPIGILPSPPLLINRVHTTDSSTNTTNTNSTTNTIIPENDGDSFFVADASGECTRLCKKQDGTMETECVLSLCRVRRGPDQRSALLLDSGSINASLKNVNNSMVDFTQHPLRYVMGDQAPLLAFYPDGAWVLML
ncbi:uncharacterized protein TM35_000064720 [Trypanosoma theileri]|uniref:Uncharacterized protein n=1 Tax=Trypanosoma theileri TaxID=67003 RepID=A0A1X0P3H4_9TRYP|nr:uncharacterized protein TM35_000064720 [Trypanosoma theileri]ORC91467.1 hypothetical protein TM35_000064720 [Trypanosoma theileri]